MPQPNRENGRKSIVLIAAWGRLKLPMDTKARFGLDDDMVRVTDGDKLYTFGVNDGAWSGISLDSGEAITLTK